MAHYGVERRLRFTELRAWDRSYRLLGRCLLCRHQAFVQPDLVARLRLRAPRATVGTLETRLRCTGCGSHKVRCYVVSPEDP